MPSSSSVPLVLVALLPLGGCGGLDQGTRDDARVECVALCGLQAQGKGCAIDLEACRAGCVVDADAFSERCLLAAQRYYACSAHVVWACPTDPGRPETEDARCAAEEHARLVCTVTGDVPPE